MDPRKPLLPVDATRWGMLLIQLSPENKRFAQPQTAQAGLAEHAHKRCQDESSPCMAPWRCPSKLTFQTGERTTPSSSLDPKPNALLFDERVRMGSVALHLHNPPATLLRDPSCFLPFGRRLVASSCTQVIP